MIRRIALTLWLALAAASCTPDEARIESPREVPARTIALTYGDDSGVSWVAEMAIDADGQFEELRLSCDGQPYATAPAGDDVPPGVFGARLEAYAGTNCSQGQVEVTVYTIAPGQMAGVPGQYVPVIFYFANSDFVGRSDVRGPEHLNPPTVEE